MRRWQHNLEKEEIVAAAGKCANVPISVQHLANDRPQTNRLLYLGNPVAIDEWVRELEQLKDVLVVRQPNPDFWQNAEPGIVGLSF